MQLPPSSLKKKHNYVAYYQCREAVAAGIFAIVHTGGKQNMSDLLNKPLGPAKLLQVLIWEIFWKE